MSVSPGDKVARIRAQLLHILYELGKDDHQFRLRYNGQVLRDAFPLSDYDITDNAVVTMIPMGKSRDVRNLKEKIYIYYFILNLSQASFNTFSHASDWDSGSAGFGLH